MKKGALLLLYFILIIAMLNFLHPKENAVLPKIPFTFDPRDEIVMVTVSRKNDVIQVPLEEYLIGVVGSEMPASFELEALKAQSVASRTFVVNRNYRVDDTVASQAYHSMDELQKLWGSSYESRIRRIQEAVASTAGEIMTYGGEVISALYFSTSNGKTANSEDYYAAALPYLRSVDSPWDLELNPNAKATAVFSAKQIQEKLGLKQTVTSIIIQSRFEDHRVKSVKVNDTVYTGREIREALGLRSSDFTITKTKQGYEFTTSGYGHGVGMSQYGAQGLALQGKTYREILSYYYQNVEIISLSEYKARN